MAGLDLRSMSDEALAAMFGDGSQPLSPAAMGEAERRDRAQVRRRKAAERRDAAEAEWMDAAHAHFLTAEARCCGNLLTRGSAVADPFPGLYRMSDRDFGRQASEEMRNFCESSPRPTRQEFMRAAFAPRKGAHPWHEPGWKEAGAVDTTPAVEEATTAAPFGAPGSPYAWAAAEHVTPAAPAPGPGAAERAAGRAERAAWAAARVGNAPAPQTAPQTPQHKPTASLPSGTAQVTPGTIAARQPASALSVPGPLVLVRQPQIDGAQVLDQAFRFTGYFGIWPSEAAKVTAALWAAHTHGKDPKTHLPVFPYAPRLFFTSDAGDAGKTRLNKTTAMISHDPVSLIESSKAGLIGMIRRYRTVIVTELDNWVGTGGRNRWLLGIGNAGYEPGHFHTHKERGKEIEVPLFGPMILDGLSSVIYNTGAELRTFVSRAIILWVTPAPASYHAPRITSQARAIGDEMRRRLAMWMAQEAADGMGDDEPDMTGLPGKRAGALWEPLLMVADRAGGHWPDLAREACLTLESPAGLAGSDQAASDRIEHALDQWGF